MTLLESDAFETPVGLQTDPIWIRVLIGCTVRGTGGAAKAAVEISTPSADTSTAMTRGLKVIATGRSYHINATLESVNPAYGSNSASTKGWASKSARSSSDSPRPT